MVIVRLPSPVAPVKVGRGLCASIFQTKACEWVVEIELLCVTENTCTSVTRPLETLKSFLCLSKTFRTGVLFLCGKSVMFAIIDRSRYPNQQRSQFPGVGHAVSLRP